MKGKVVLITGASSGIGKACAKVFGEAGARVVITGRHLDTLQPAEEYLKSLGIDVLKVVADVSNEADCHRMVVQAVAKYGKVDVLINNAGISMRALFEEVDTKVIRQVMDTNFYGMVYSTKAALPQILTHKGSIVGISSVAGYRGLPGRTGYSASKFAMHGFLEALRTELLYRGVHVLLACPGFTSSNIRNTALAADGASQQESPIDESKLMPAEAVAKLILNAVLNRKRSIVLTSQGKITVLLNKLLPGWMDKMVYRHFKHEPDSPLK